MNCTHPVLYHNAQGSLVCHICGAVLADEHQTDKTSETAKPAAGQKTGNKRTRKKTTDDETA